MLWHGSIKKAGKRHTTRLAHLREGFGMPESRSLRNIRPWTFAAANFQP
jgi:hypothetical protein